MRNRHLKNMSLLYSFLRSFILGHVKAKVDYVAKRVDIADLRIKLCTVD